jgi:hypothetical protein
MMNPICQTLPGLGNFFLCGQGVEPGGGLLQVLCREDGTKLKTTVS